MSLFKYFIIKSIFRILYNQLVILDGVLKLISVNPNIGSLGQIDCKHAYKNTIDFLEKHKEIDIEINKYNKLNESKN